jgi:hypothetical protein
MNFDRLVISLLLLATALCGTAKSLADQPLSIHKADSSSIINPAN